jgi:hypothetical protein
LSELQDLEFESGYWGDCTNTFDEEQKQYVYARCMGLTVRHFQVVTPPKIRILDVGGGPASLMLKVSDLQEGLVWDPLLYPKWTWDRYAAKNIRVHHAYGENLDEQGWDEVWLYNCLQHTHDPARIIANCLRAGKVFRLFEWIDIPPHDGHPQMLTQELLDQWTGARGRVAEFNNEQGCMGRAYFNAIVTGS